MPPQSVDGPPSITRSEAEGIALAAAKMAVTETHQKLFQLFGVNMANFEAIEEFRKDIEFLRTLRSGARATGARFGMAIVGMIALAFAYGMWEVFRAAVGRH